MAGAVFPGAYTTDQSPVRQRFQASLDRGFTERQGLRQFLDGIDHIDVTALIGKTVFPGQGPPVQQDGIEKDRRTGKLHVQKLPRDRQIPGEVGIQAKRTQF